VLKGVSRANALRGQGGDFVDAKLTQEIPARIEAPLSIVKAAQVRDVRILRQVGRFQISDDYALPNAADLMNEIDLR
jgi:hypothetical protein